LTATADHSGNISHTQSQRGEGEYKSPEPFIRTTGGELHAKNRKIQRGNIPRKKFFKIERAYRYDE